jgi:PAS domain S-box-containing protein
MLALAVSFGVILLDVLLGGRVILVELLVAGPLIAAMRATATETAIVAALAFAVSIPLGLASHAFLEAAHVAGVVAVAIGGALAVVIARLRSDGERDAARLRVQYGVARVLAESDSAEEAGPRLLEAIAAPLGWRAGHLWEPDEDEHLTCTAAWVGEGPDLAEFERATHELRAAPGRGLPGRVWQSREPAWVSDLSSDEGFLRREGAAAGNLRCGMAFPVLSSERPLAVIEVFSHEHRELDRPLVALTEALGAQIGDFIERVRATRAVRESEDRARESRDQLEAMLRGVADAVTVQAPDGRLLFVNDAAVSTLGFDSPAALLEAAPAEILAGFEIFDPDGRPFPVSDLPGRRALGGEEGAEAVVRFRVKATGEERWANIKATPVRDGGGDVSMAINVIEDISAHKRAELSQRFLARTSEVLSHWVGTEEVLEQVAGLVVPEVADWCAVDLVTDAGELERVVLTHAEPDRREHALELSRRYPPDPASSAVYRVMRNAMPELYPEITEQALRATCRDEKQYELLRGLGMRSALIVPMSVRERTLGVLTLVTGPSGRRFDETDLALAEELARRCATAIDNTRLYHERSYIARTLQQSLLPLELPEMPGIEAAARFRPIGEGNEVGGDFYDLFESGGRGWAVVMGDVCGKGPDAAAVTALARYTLRAAAMRERLPSRSLRLLNEALLRQRDDKRFCTVAYAYLEVLDEGARLGLASGGHPLPLLVRRDGDVEQVGAAGTLLGVVPDPDFEDRSVTLFPGDLLVFYTDGVIESQASGQPLDEDRLAALLSACAGDDADSVAAKVEQAALRSQGGRARDDIAVLVLRVAR